MKTGQDYIKHGGHAICGFNRRIYGESYNDAFQHPHERQDYEMQSGWELADSLIKKGEIYSIHNFHRLECHNGYAFQYGGFWVCNSCERKSVDKPWWTIKVMKDGNAWCCIGEGFENLQESENYAFGDTRDEAISNYGDLMANAPT